MTLGEKEALGDVLAETDLWRSNEDTKGATPCSAKEAPAVTFRVVNYLPHTGRVGKTRN